jgi:hypothetical protein
MPRKPIPQKDPNRLRTHRVPVHFNDAELSLLDKLVHRYHKATINQLLTTPLVDRSSLIRYMVVKAALALPKEGK